MQEFDEVVNWFDDNTDGEKAFVRLNRFLINLSSCISQRSLLPIIIFFYSRCLVKVTKEGKKIGCSDKANQLGAGKWSKDTDINEILRNVCTSDEYDSGSQNSNVAKRVKKLLCQRMFYKFEVSVGKSARCTIYTYNRFTITIGTIWPEADDENFSPPTTPRNILSLSSNESYKNAIHRMYFGIKDKISERSGNWRTESQIRENIKVAFCKFLYDDLISSSCESVKSKFVSYEKSGFAPDEYVSHVNQVAESLSKYEGINQTEEFFKKLVVSKACHDDMIRIMNGTSSGTIDGEDTEEAHAVDVENITHEDEVTIVNSTIQEGVSESETIVNSTIEDGQNSKIYHLGTPEIVKFTIPEEVKTGVNTMNDNELQKSAQNTYRCINSRCYTVEVHNTENKENEDSEPIIENPEKAFSEGVDPHRELQYNVAMNEIQQKDMSMSVEVIDENSSCGMSLDFSPKPQKKLVKKPTPQIDAEAVAEEKFRAAGIAHNAKKARQASKQSITESSQEFLREYEKIVKAAIRGAKFPYGDNLKLEHANAQKAMDLLLKYGVLDEGVIRSWMNHTARSLKTYSGGVIKMSFMLREWDKFRKGLPSQEVVARRKALFDEAPIQAGSVIRESLESVFDGGISESSAFTACGKWGMVIVVQYLVSAKGMTLQDAYDLSVSGLKGKSRHEIRYVLSVTAKYEKVTSKMELGEWRDAVDVILRSVGELEKFEASRADYDEVEKFSHEIDGSVK